MLDRRITYIVCLLRELTASQLVAIATHSDTGSHNRLDLIQSFVPPHYVCNGYLSFLYIIWKRLAENGYHDVL